MYKNIDIDANTLNSVLEISRTGRLHVRHIARKIGVSATTASTLLRTLNRLGVLERETIGKNCLYSLKNSLISKKLVSMAEQNAMINFLTQNPKINTTVEEIMKSISEFIPLIECLILTQNPTKLTFVSRLDEVELRILIKTVEKRIKQKIEYRIISKNELRDKETILDNYFILHGADFFIRTRRN